MTSTNVLVLLKFWGGLFPDLLLSLFVLLVIKSVFTRKVKHNRNSYL